MVENPIETPVEEETEPVEEAPEPARVNLDEEEAEPMHEPEQSQEEPPARKVSPGAAEALSGRYEEPDYDQPEYRPRPPGRRPPPEPGYSDTNFMSNLMSGDVGLGEALLVMDYWDRRDKKDKDPQGLTREDIPAIVAAALENAGLSGKPRDEMPAWAEEQQKTLNALTERFEEEAQEKRDKKLIDDVTKPLLAALDTEREKRELIEKKIEELGKPPEPGAPKSELDAYIDYKEKMIKAGFLKEEKGTLTFGKDGIPVEGAIPAWALYMPTMADEVFDNVEKRIVNIFGMFGAGKEKKGLHDLIQMPPKPKPKTERPPLRPAEHEPEPEPVAEPPSHPLEELPQAEEPPEIEPEPLKELIPLPTRKPENLLVNRVPPEPESPELELEEETIDLPPSEEVRSITEVDIETTKINLEPEPEPEVEEETVELPPSEEAPLDTEIEEETLPPPEEYLCPDCGKPFSSLKSLRGHCGATGHHYPDALRTSKDQEEEEP